MNSKGKKKNRANPKRTKLIKLMASGKTLTESAKEAGYGTKQAASKAISQAREKFSYALERHGLTDDALVDKYLLPLMNAKETLFFQHQGIVLDKRKVAALGTRVSALDMALKLKGSYPKNGSDDKSNNGGGPPQIVIHLGAFDPERAFALLTGQSGGSKPS